MWVIAPNGAPHPVHGCEGRGSIPAMTYAASTMVIFATEKSTSVTTGPPERTAAAYASSW